MRANAITCVLRISDFKTNFCINWPCHIEFRWEFRWKSFKNSIVMCNFNQKSWIFQQLYGFSRISVNVYQNMDFERSYFGKSEPPTSWTLLPLLFSWSALIWTKSEKKVFNWSEVHLYWSNFLQNPFLVSLENILTVIFLFYRIFHNKAEIRVSPSSLIFAITSLYYRYTRFSSSHL